ncbi:toll/interleukin-1 receptor domain-containing protein [Micromonospora sp. ZYX-F-536]|uniref:toll/interleukin-1 receptor domain-containing protein n=1 Tax=Micromonospora sp. ZYX-F-536 TaxID=3457629 RepID=UPI004040A46F
MTSESANAPVAFVSHASEDKASFAEPLSRRLAALGVQPWLDKWEIRPGDSLVQRLFDEGLKTADAVILVTSKDSAEKRWVREELDSAAVSRIERGTRLIPVRLDEVEMPEPLRHLVWLPAERTSESIDRVAAEIADLLHNVSRRPVVGVKPRYIEMTSSIPGLTAADSFVLCEAIRQAIANGHLIALRWGEIEERAKEAGIPNSRILESVHALAEGDYLDADIRNGGVVIRLSLTPYGFDAGIENVVPDITEIRYRIIAILANGPQTGGQTADSLAQDVGSEPLVVDQVLKELESRDLVAAFRALGGLVKVHRVSPTVGRLLEG